MLHPGKLDVLFSQGDVANAVFYIQKGRVKLTAVSPQGKEAVIGILDQGAFFGEGCLAGQLVCVVTATALKESMIARIDKAAMMRMLRDEPTVAALFLAYLLAHSVRVRADLVDHLFNSAEKRLARILLLMAHFGEEGQPALTIPKISQEMLAGMVGTTRSRVSFFMKRFKQLGFIRYNAGLHVHSSLLNVVLHD